MKSKESLDNPAHGVTVGSFVEFEKLSLCAPGYRTCPVLVEVPSSEGSRYP